MKKGILILFLLAFFVLPTLTFAQFGPLVPECNTVNPMSRQVECNSCDLVRLAQNIINWFIYAAGVAAVLMFAYAGIIYATSATNPEQIAKAHKIFWNVLLGMVFVLAAWLIVDTIMKALYKTDSKFGPWNGILCARTGARVDPLDDTSVVGTVQTSTGQTTSGQGSGSLSSITTVGKNGEEVTIAFPTTRSDQDLQSTYQQVTGKYGSQIQDACNAYGGAMTDCTRTVAAFITVESSGKADAGAGTNSIGLMQVQPANAISGCGLADTSCNVNSGVKYLSQQYSKFGNDLPNATAAYNSGPSSVPGQGTTGGNTAMVASVNCPGLYAYQCSTNPGNLSITQAYVANICRTMSLQGGSC